MTIKQPTKRPIVTPEERAYYDPELLSAIIYGRSLGVVDYPAKKDQPEPPNPRFEEPEEGEDLTCYIPENIVDLDDYPELLALIDKQLLLNRIITK